MPLDNDAAFDIGRLVYNRLVDGPSHLGGGYDTALATLTQTEIRALMREAAGTAKKAPMLARRERR